MKLRRLLLCLVIPLVLATHVATAGTPNYVAPATLPPQLLPAPPAEGSPDWQNQVQEVLTAQRGLSEDELTAIHNEQTARLEMITPVVSKALTREQVPKTFALLDRVMADAGSITDADKKFWNTRRPYAADQHVKLLVEPIENPSYPSGHTSETRVVAEVLAILFPAQRDALRARAEEIAQRRIEAGVHYPVDIEGGRLLAMLIMGALMRSEIFHQDLAAAQAEIAGFKF